MIKLLTCSRGVTLIQQLVVVAIIAIMVAVAIPNVMSWRGEAQTRRAARELLLMFREARSRAVSENMPFRVVVDVPGNEYDLQRDAGGGWTDIWKDVPIPDAAFFKSGADCTSNANVTVEFYATGGASNEAKVCVIDHRGAIDFTVEVTSTISGTAKITN